MTNIDVALYVCNFLTRARGLVRQPARAGTPTRGDSEDHAVAAWEALFYVFLCGPHRHLRVRARSFLALCKDQIRSNLRRSINL